MKIESLAPGQVVYDVGTQRMGNTTIRSVSVWEVLIESIDRDSEVVVASWNGNPARRYYRGEWSKWRKSKPILVKSGFGYRLASRAEIAAMKDKT